MITNSVYDRTYETLHRIDNDVKETLIRKMSILKDDEEVTMVNMGAGAIMIDDKEGWFLPFKININSPSEEYELYGDNKSISKIIAHFGTDRIQKIWDDIIICICDGVPITPVIGEKLHYCDWDTFSNIENRANKNDLTGVGMGACYFISYTNDEKTHMRVKDINDKIYIVDTRNCDLDN